MQFHNSFGCYVRTTAWSGLQQIQQSSGYPLAGISSLECTCDVQSNVELYQKLCKAAKLLALRTDYCRRDSKLIRGQLQNYYISQDCFTSLLTVFSGINQLAAFVNIRITCLLSSSPKSEFKGFNPHQNLRSPSFLAAQRMEALTICIPI